MKVSIRGKEIYFERRTSFWEEAANEKWEPKSFEILDLYIRPGKIFIDCGAWVGPLSLYAEKIGAKVYAIEPDKIAALELFENILANDSDIIVSSIAIADKNGFTYLNSMTSDGFGNSESSLLRRGKGGGDSMKVKCCTLSEYVKANNINQLDICLIKIDIEGGEVALIKEAAGFFREYKPTLYISFHPAWFKDLNNNVDMIIDILFPIYSVISVLNNRVYSKAEFRKTMLSYTDNTFIFKTS